MPEVRSSTLANPGDAAPETGAAARWSGRILSAIPALFLLLDGVMKLVQPAPVIEATLQLGYPGSVITGLGIVLCTSAILALIPWTALLGAILLTAYLGGAVAAQVRVGGPLFSHVLFPVYLGVILWSGLWLRDRRLRTLIPWRRQFPTSG